MAKEFSFKSASCRCDYRYLRSSSAFNKKDRLATEHVIDTFWRSSTRWGTISPGSCWPLPLFRADAPPFYLKNRRTFSQFPIYFTTILQTETPIAGDYLLAPDVLFLLVQDGSARLLDLNGNVSTITLVGAKMLYESLRTDTTTAAARIAAEYCTAVSLVQNHLHAFLFDLEQVRDGPLFARMKHLTGLFLPGFCQPLRVVMHYRTVLWTMPGKAYHLCPQTGLSVTLYAIMNRVGNPTRWYVAAPLGIAIAHPFLDVRLLSFGLGMQSRIQPEPGRMKPVLAETMRGMLPDQIIDRQDKRFLMKSTISVLLVICRAWKR